MFSEFQIWIFTVAACLPIFAKKAWSWPDLVDSDLKRLAMSSAVVDLFWVDRLKTSDKAFFAWVNALRLIPTSLIEWASTKRVSSNSQKNGHRQNLPGKDLNKNGSMGTTFIPSNAKPLRMWYKRAAAPASNVTRRDIDDANASQTRYITVAYFLQISFCCSLV